MAPAGCGLHRLRRLVLALLLLPGGPTSRDRVVGLGVGLHLHHCRDQQRTCRHRLRASFRPLRPTLDDAGWLSPSGRFPVAHAHGPAGAGGGGCFLVRSLRRRNANINRRHRCRQPPRPCLGAAFGLLTLVFGLAQVLGPPFARVMAESTGSFAIPFLIASLFALGGAGCAIALWKRPN